VIRVGQIDFGFNNSKNISKSVEQTVMQTQYDPHYVATDSIQKYLLEMNFPKETFRNRSGVSEA
jgi:hypothetical protein